MQKKQWRQKQKTPDPKHVTPFLLHPCCISYGIPRRNKGVGNVRTHVRMQPRCKGLNNNVKSLILQTQHHHDFPFSSWFHPNGMSIKKKSGLFETCRDPDWMQPGCNKKNNNDKTQILQTPNISVLVHPVCILMGFRKKSGKVKPFQNPMRMQPGCNRKNADDKTQILQTPNISHFCCCVLVVILTAFQTQQKKQEHVWKKKTKSR